MQARAPGVEQGREAAAVAEEKAAAERAVRESAEQVSTYVHRSTPRRATTPNDIMQHAYNTLALQYAYMNMKQYKTA